MEMEIPTGSRFKVSAIDPDKVEKGDWYLGTNCRGCEQWFAIFTDAAKGAPRSPIRGEGWLVVTCPRCDVENAYVPSQIQQKQA